MQMLKKFVDACKCDKIKLHHFSSVHSLFLYILILAVHGDLYVWKLMVKRAFKLFDDN